MDLYGLHWSTWIHINLLGNVSVSGLHQPLNLLVQKSRIQVQTSNILVQTPRIPVQTSEYKSRHPKYKSRHPNIVQTSKIQVQTSKIRFQTPKTHINPYKSDICSISIEYFHVFSEYVCIFPFTFLKYFRGICCICSYLLMLLIFSYLLLYFPIFLQTPFRTPEYPSCPHADYVHCAIYRASLSVGQLDGRTTNPSVGWLVARTVRWSASWSVLSWH